MNVASKNETLSLIPQRKTQRHHHPQDRHHGHGDDNGAPNFSLCAFLHIMNDAEL
jgi:hypothetical protein